MELGKRYRFIHRLWTTIWYTPHSLSLLCHGEIVIQKFLIVHTHPHSLLTHQSHIAHSHHHHHQQLQYHIGCMLVHSDVWIKCWDFPCILNAYYMIIILSVLLFYHHSISIPFGWGFSGLVFYKNYNYHNLSPLKVVVVVLHWRKKNTVAKTHFYDPFPISLSLTQAHSLSP